jgi:hypothetical protein
MMKHTRLAAVCLTTSALFLAPAALLAQAQPQTPAKPSAKPAPAAAPKAASDKTLSFAAGSGKGPILSKDELRSASTKADGRL